MIPTVPSGSRRPSQPANQIANVLALEVIGREGSIAWSDGEGFASRALSTGSSRAAATLGVALAELWDSPGFREPDFIAVADGPGSFTGLRIAVTTAKSLAYALDVPVVAIDSMAAIAASTIIPDHTGNSDHTVSRGDTGSRGDTLTLRVGLQAYRGQVFTADFQPDVPTDRWNEMARDADSGCHSRLVSGQRWAEMLHQPIETTSGEVMLAAGDASVFADADSDRWIFTSPKPGRTWAWGVATMATLAIQNGQISPAMNLLPRYFRPSAAEEKANQAAAD